jgi:hypothetical protein
MNPEIQYWTSEASQAFPLSLFISSDGLATLEVGSNRDDPSQQTVGMFRTRLDRSITDDLILGLQSQAFADMENPASIQPGEPVRKLAIKEENRKEIVKWAAIRTPTPEAFLSAEKKAEFLVMLVRQYPILAVSVAVANLPPEIHRDKPVAFKMIIHNPGFEAVQIGYPARPFGDHTLVQLVGLRSDVPLEELADYHQKFQELTTTHILNVEAGRMANRLIAIAPKENATIAYSIALDWPPGQYEMNLVFITPLFNRDGARQMDVEILSSPRFIRVLGEPKPDDVPDEIDEDRNLEDEGDE